MTGLMDFPFDAMDKEMSNTEKKLYGKKAGRIMKTDIREKDNGYELVIDLPGFTEGRDQGFCGEWLSDHQCSKGT